MYKMRGKNKWFIIIIIIISLQLWIVRKNHLQKNTYAKKNE